MAAEGEAMPFAFNFFGGSGGGGGGGATTTTAAHTAAAAASDPDSDADAAAEARAEAAAEAEADALLARAAGGAAGSAVRLAPVDGETWPYSEVAEEVEGVPVARSGEGPPAGASYVELPGCDVRLLKCHVDSSTAAALLGDAAVQESDLVPGRYEGGFKLWEGGVDLAAYLAGVHSLTAAGLAGGPDGPEGGGLQGLRVLELGCGHGLPGVLCLLAGAEVHFQDYNREVLAGLTAANVAANVGALPRGALRQRARYFSGDWLAVGQLLSAKGLDASYDLVLTAETIYSAQGSARLLEAIKQVLRPPHGIALVAAKSYYFGVGGGTAAFAAAVAADGTLEAERAWVVEDGASNKREILKLRFPIAISPYFQ